MIEIEKCCIHFDLVVILVTSNVMNGAPTSPASQETAPLRKATKAKKEIKLAMMLATSITAFDAPWAAASSALASLLNQQISIKRIMNHCFTASRHYLFSSLIS